ncbi:molybdopterin molybdotransferase MoeA [Microbacterium sp. M28]|uniref:molybdopterin molybdotransferase MoeA n=1 Tax=Microbacterium sp. M28 TaxID=2962064 RepID=UPI0021F47F93|nr:gephyrin-like molybdotransferase Glp [Microbacterium sp. M28]UYO95886.1 molybdopterin molybdotransferase MoeA [Microbacterium sp. M28]
MIPIEEHRSRILAVATPLPPRAHALLSANGLVLADAVSTRWPVPLFDNSAMDGYAVRTADAVEGARLRVVADVPAGSADDPRFGRGEAVRIMTGAAVPTDADAIVPVEHTDLGVVTGAVPPEHITITRAPREAAHIRRRGEDAAAGTVVVDAGTALGPWQLATIASAGHDRVRAHPAPRAAVISTGSELVPAGAEPRRGQIPESNSLLIAAALQDAGAVVVHVGTVPDDEAALRSELAAVDADLVVLSGGASVGAFDVVKAVLDIAGPGRGTVRFDAVAMQPGKPQGFGVAPDGTLLFCLPGNPVSVAVSFEMFVRPAVRSMAGRQDLDRPRTSATVGQGWRCPPGRVQVLPVVFRDGRVVPASAGGSGSHLVASLAQATDFAIVPAETERVETGDLVDVMLVATEREIS